MEKYASSHEIKINKDCSVEFNKTKNKELHIKIKTFKNKPVVLKEDTFFDICLAISKYKNTVGCKYE